MHPVFVDMFVGKKAPERSLHNADVIAEYFNTPVFQIPVFMLYFFWEQHCQHMKPICAKQECISEASAASHKRRDRNAVIANNILFLGATFFDLNSSSTRWARLLKRLLHRLLGGSLHRLHNRKQTQECYGCNLGHLLSHTHQSE